MVRFLVVRFMTGSAMCGCLWEVCLLLFIFFAGFGWNWVSLYVVKICFLKLCWGCVVWIMLRFVVVFWNILFIVVCLKLFVCCVLVVVVWVGLCYWFFNIGSVIKGGKTSGFSSLGSNLGNCWKFWFVFCCLIGVLLKILVSVNGKLFWKCLFIGLFLLFVNWCWWCNYC